ncbi:MAG: outer membrane lipoprotein-sorting protein [Candidatus Omnitrophica bacterium]|nr:outer membrane lipoprotein-sorting protein [Candidatus Omnitrophota bacterium]
MLRCYRYYLLLLMLLSPISVFSQDLNALRIMEEAFRRDDGRDAYFKIEMTLIDNTGNERKRLLEVYTKDYADLMKTFIRFLEPADIKDTSFLSLEYNEDEDIQYLYLPALGRVRRIVSSQKNLRFMNTDFTYEDMQRRRPEKDEHRVICEEIFDGRQCYVVESLPKDKSQYSKRVSWIDKESRMILKIDFYNKSGQKSKVFRVVDLDKRQNIWTALKVVMEDLEDKHSTRMQVVEVKYNQGINDDTFNPYKLE